MKTTAPSWFSIGRPGNTVMNCAACGKEFDLGVPGFDHHPQVCPVCSTECVFLDWKNRLVQILTQAAPARLPEVIRWLQENFDELEYVELACALEEIADAIHSSTEPQLR